MPEDKILNTIFNVNIIKGKETTKKLLSKTILEGLS